MRIHIRENTCPYFLFPWVLETGIDFASPRVALVGKEGGFTPFAGLGAGVEAGLVLFDMVCNSSQHHNDCNNK